MVYKGIDAQGREGLKGWERWEGTESIKREKQDLLLVHHKMAGFVQQFMKTLPKVFR